MESVGGREAIRQAGLGIVCVEARLMIHSTHQVLAVVVHAVGRAAEGEVGVVVVGDLRPRGGELVHLHVGGVVGVWGGGVIRGLVG